MQSKSATIGPAITAAKLYWPDRGPPLSIDYDDVYFSRAGGCRESEHVFIAGNHLAERFQALPPKGVFTIAETGFGCGLNLLVTWACWEKHAPENAVLHFISVENSPLSQKDLARSHLPWPHLAEKSITLQNQYPHLVAGVHRCLLENQAEQNITHSEQTRANLHPAGSLSAATSARPASLATKIRLTLFFGEVNDWLETTSFYADAWFLDGFSPKKNPDIWSASVLKGIRQHSTSGTTLATYTVAGGIRRGLAEQGFSVSKAAGFGSKRFMTLGNYLPAEKSAIHSSQGVPEGSRVHHTAQLRSNFNHPAGDCLNPTKNILLVGSGLAGSLLARNLAERGHQVEVLEASEQSAAGASGNRQGALYVKLAVDFNPHTRYHLASYLFAISAYSHWLAPESQLWNVTGVLQLAQTEKERLRQAKFLSRSCYPESIVYPVDKAVAEQLTGVALNSGGLLFPQGGWCRPAEICSNLLQHPLITLHTHAAVSHQQTLSNGVTLSTRRGMLHHGDCAIYCTGQLPTVSGLVIKSALSSRIRSIKGQISQFILPAAGNMPLQTVICGEGYAMPAVTDDNSQPAGIQQQVMVTGSTFHPRAVDLQATHEDDLENLRRLGDLSPTLRDFADNCSARLNVTGRASARAALTDYFPVVGSIQQHTYLNLGYGSKGLALAPLAGELIADLICQRPLPLDNELIRRLSPLRFAN